MGQGYGAEGQAVACTSSVPYRGAGSRSRSLLRYLQPGGSSSWPLPSHVQDQDGILASAWPVPGGLGHLGSEPADAKGSLSPHLCHSPC